jgi:hypothetical protein
MSVNWVDWYDETLDALVQTLENGSVTWGTDPDGDPWVIVGDRTSAGITYPACFIPEFTKVRTGPESDTKSELHDIQTVIWVIRAADVKEQEANLREAIRTGARLENDLYNNRTLNRTCSRLVVEEMEPGAGVIDGQAVQTVSLTLTLMKPANIH